MKWRNLFNTYTVNSILGGNVYRTDKLYGIVGMVGAIIISLHAA